MKPGTRVTVIRPDRYEHRSGTVVESHGSLWTVWVQHLCDCYQTGTPAPHVRGYDESELTEAS